MTFCRSKPTEKAIRNRKMWSFQTAETTTCPRIAAMRAPMVWGTREVSSLLLKVLPSEAENKSMTGCSMRMRHQDPLKELTQNKSQPGMTFRLAKNCFGTTVRQFLNPTGLINSLTPRQQLNRLELKNRKWTNLTITINFLTNLGTQLRANAMQETTHFSIWKRRITLRHTTTTAPMGGTVSWRNLWMELKIFWKRQPTGCAHLGRQRQWPSSKA